MLQPLRHQQPNDGPGADLPTDYIFGVLNATAI